MSLFARRHRRELSGHPGASELIRARTGTTAGVASVNSDTAMRHSAVWACLRLRAGLISTMPVDVYRKVDGIQVEVPKPPVLVKPGGSRVGIREWLYASQVDLDRSGNTFGLITERNASGLPLRIDLQPVSACSVIDRSGEISYRIRGKVYPEDQVWHERAYVVAGLPVGLSPVAYAAYSIGQYQSAQQFALEWYAGGGVPKAHFRNTMVGQIDQETAELAKARFRASVANGDLFVSGRDWEYDPIQAEAVGKEWLDAQQFGIADVARFFDVPGDLIDAAVSTGNITYASISQRNLQFLIMHLGPAVIAREDRLSELLPAPRFVKLNTSALLRMDDETRARVIKTRIDSRVLAPSEARALDNLPPLTPAQEAEFDRLFPKKAPAEGDEIPEGAQDG